MLLSFSFLLFSFFFFFLRRKAVILEVKPGGLGSNQYPLKLSNSLNTLLNKDTKLLRVGTLTPGDSVEHSEWRRLETFHLIEGGPADGIQVYI
jgi:hypothetical protein